MESFNEQHYWNTNSYGQALRVHKKTLRTLATLLCIITPFTNWLIPLAYKLIKEDFVVRYNK